MRSQKNSTTDHIREDSWEQILSENTHWIRQILVNRLNNSDEVDEVFQELGLSVVRSETPPGEIKNQSAWLYRVAIRQVLIYRRKKGRYKKLLDNFGSKVAPSAAVDTTRENPLALVLRTERTAAIRQILHKLNETDREVLMLKYSENWTYKQLAEKLGVSIQTIEHRLVKAKKTLRKLLANLQVEVKV